MSICGGIAGYRGAPKGVFIHNDAGSQNANALFYQNWLPNTNLENGFANAYVCSDGTVFAEDDTYGSWHCSNSYYNLNYYSIEACQSMGDLETFKKNEENALKLAAEICSKYGIVPSDNTIMLHQEVFTTACPHRSVEIHGGASATKQYFIEQIKSYMNGTTEAAITVEERKGEIEMQCFYTVDGGKNPMMWYDGTNLHPLAHPDEKYIINEIYKANNGKDMPVFDWPSTSPWHRRFQEAVARVGAPIK